VVLLLVEIQRERNELIKDRSLAARGGTAAECGEAQAKSAPPHPTLR